MVQYGQCFYKLYQVVNSRICNENVFHFIQKKKKTHYVFILYSFEIKIITGKFKLNKNIHSTKST